jgi:ppGpp synthetase/RelA/SpoT-type nucleotidyltranferase
MLDFTTHKTQSEILFDHNFLDWFYSKNNIITEQTLIQKPKDFQQPWGDVDAEEEYLGVWYDNIRKDVLNVKDNFLHKLKTASRRVKMPKVVVDVKSAKSFIDKVVNRGKKPNQITDVLRSAILVETENDIYKVVKGLKKEFKVLEYEIKQKDDDPEFGYYGSHHLLVDVNGMASEIQVMTKKLWNYKEEQHKIYNKLRSLSDVDKEYEKFLKNTSKRGFIAGNRAKSIPNKKKRR